MHSINDKPPLLGHMAPYHIMDIELLIETLQMYTDSFCISDTTQKEFLDELNERTKSD